MAANHAISWDEWDGSYFRRLVPYLVLSLVLHIAGYGIGFGLATLFGGGRGIEVQLYEASETPLAPGEHPLLSGIFGVERLKFFRVDFFKEIVPFRPPEPEPPVEEVTPPSVEPPEEIEEPIEQETEEPSPAEEEIPALAEEMEEEIEAEEPAPSEEVSSPADENGSALLEHPREVFDRPTWPSDGADGGLPPEAGPPARVEHAWPPVLQPALPGTAHPSGEALPDALGIFPGEWVGESRGPVLPLPQWEFTDIDGVEWSAGQFLGNYTIYIIGDVSRRHGLDELLAWNFVLRQLVTNPQAAYPPNVAVVATSIENPYAYGERRVRATLDRAREEESCFGVMLVDLQAELSRSLGYYELPQPMVVFVDNYGYIRMVLIGRIRDISTRNIEAAMEVIADMWQWDEQEEALLPPVVILLINVLREMADDPAQRRVPPPDIAHQIAPTWGCPPLPEE